MGDMADLAQAQSERLDAARMSYRYPVAPLPTGFCFNCDEPLPDSRRWCDVECRDYWERLEAVKKTRGT
jgi:hypothetical protein